MREGVPSGGRNVSMALLFCVIVAAAARSGRCAAIPDTTGGIGWSILYGNRIDLIRDDDVFPWNDAEAAAQRNDRFVAMFELHPPGGIDLFFKGASGVRREEPGIHRNRFVLSQGHAGLSLFGDRVRGRVFLRERAFRTENRLLTVVSNDAPILDGRGMGIRIEAEDASRRYRAAYVDATLRTEDLSIHGGLPAFTGGGDIFRILSGSLSSGGSSIGIAASQVRSLEAGDGVMLGVDLNLAVRGVRIMSELLHSGRGNWGDFFSLAEETYLDAEADETRQPSTIFSKRSAFSAEIDGVGIRSQRLGFFHLVPGYRYHGEDFRDPQGEIHGGLNEGYMTVWWLHQHSDAAAAVELCDHYDGVSDERYQAVRILSRMRFTGGFELRENALFVEGMRPSFLLSIVDENGRTRMLATVRLDDTGGANDLSLLTEGQMNLSSSWALRSTLYLYRAERSYYTMELEFRPAKRFLLRAAIGSFRPNGEDILLNREIDPALPPEERWLSIYTRMWFGNM